MRQRSAAAILAAAGALITVSLACAQPQQPEVLASFNGPNGEDPQGLTLGRDGNFYGTTFAGGASTNQYGEGGTMFRITTNGVLTTLVSFYGENGLDPDGALVLGNDGNFYGTTWHGGTGPYGTPYGTVFRVTTKGVLTTLVSFDSGGTDGYGPNGLALGCDGNFYGTTVAGTVYKVTTNGVLATLASFNGTNGAYPQAGLTLGGDGNFYGTTQAGGHYGPGTAFRVTTNGVVTTLCSFSFNLPSIYYSVYPSVLTFGSDGNLYGTTQVGGDTGNGNVFRVTTNGLLTTLVSFNGTNGSRPNGLTRGSDGNFYGTTSEGGAYGVGTVFQAATNGTLTTLVSFAGTNGASPDAFPEAGLTQGTDGNFYGTASGGGDGGYGVIYRLRHGVSVQSFGMKTNGFQLNTLNVGGSGWVVVESSSDLMTWTPIQTNGTAAVQQFLDPTALTQPHQFYRVRQQ